MQDDANSDSDSDEGAVGGMPLGGGGGFGWGNFAPGGQYQGSFIIEWACILGVSLLSFNWHQYYKHTEM